MQNLTSHNSPHLQKQHYLKRLSKNMKIPSIFKNKPPRTHTKTHSFRAWKNDVSMTLNSVFLDIERHDHSLAMAKSSSNSSFSTDDEVFEETQSLEMMISTVRLSERLFFEPEETSSIVKESKTGNANCPFKDSVALVLESYDPYLDFKKSMQEMVESEELLEDWDCLEELLWWYLKVNGKMNHGFIVGAFVDLLVGFADADSKKTMMSCSESSASYSAAYSSSSSPPFPCCG